MSDNEELKEEVKKLKKKIKKLDKERSRRLREEKKNYVRKYEIDINDIKKIRKIGGGGQGSVFEVKWMNGGGNIRVAVKYIKSFYDMNRITFFDLELYKVKEQLFHPCICQIFGFIVPDVPPDDFRTNFPNGYGIVMEKMDGDLLKLVKRKHLSIYRKCVLMLKMTIAINYLHTKNVIHRDIKCQNFLYSHGGKIIKVSDLGIARTPTGENTEEGVIVSETAVGGTWRWEAPEIHKGRDHNGKSIYSFKTDIWALGCAFFEIMFERKPYSTYEKKNKNWGRLMLTRMIFGEENQLKPDMSVAKNLPKSVSDLFTQLFRYEPARRISTPKILRYIEGMCRKYREKYDDKYLKFKDFKRFEEEDGEEEEED